MILTRIGKRKSPDGKPVTTYGFRFWYRNRLYKKMVRGTRAMAVEAEKRLRSQLDVAAFEGEYGPLRPRLTTWTEATAMYEEAKANKVSLPSDRRHLRWWGDFLKGQGVTYLQEVAPEHLDKAQASLRASGLKPATVYQYMACLRGLCRLAFRRWGILRRNPTQAVDWPSVRGRQVRIPTDSERSAILQHAPEPLRTLVLTAMYTGLRKAAVLRIQAGDLTVRPGWLRTVQKGNREHWVPVATELRLALDALGVISGPLFRRKDGTQLTRWPEELWRDVREKAGCPWLRVHDLRHTTASLLADSGVPQPIIKAFLGHATLAMSDRYTHPLGGAMEGAARRLGKRVGKRKAN